jgi:hypothetical protein
MDMVLDHRLPTSDKDGLAVFLGKVNICGVVPGGFDGGSSWLMSMMEPSTAPDCVVRTPEGTCQ